MSTISIVIPTFNNWHLTHQLLADIYQYNRDADEILIIDDASTEQDVTSGSEWWRASMLPQLQLHRCEENMKFLRAANWGVSKATGDIILLVSNDVRMQDNIVHLIKSAMNLDSQFIMGGILYSGSTGWNEFKNGKGHRIFPYLEGWLLIFSRKAWNEIGGFDELYAPYDFEDVDFSTKAVSLGYALVPLSSTKVRHLGSQTIGYNPAREKITKRNQQRFAEKWGVTVP
jgi:GT2 family glycosyltransferase